VVNNSREIVYSLRPFHHNGHAGASGLRGDLRMPKLPGNRRAALIRGHYLASGCLLIESPPDNRRGLSCEN